MTNARVRAASLVWYLYLASYIGALGMGLLTVDAIPLFAGLPLVVASVLFALLTWSAMSRRGLGLIAASLAQLVIALLLLGGQGRSWHFGSHNVIKPPGFPPSLVASAWVIAMVLPLALAAMALLATRRFR